MTFRKHKYKKEQMKCRHCDGEGITSTGSCGKCWGTGLETVWNMNIVVDENGKETKVEGIWDLNK